MKINDNTSIFLYVESGIEKGSKFNLNIAERAVIGRESTADICINNDFQLSREHFVLYFSDSNFIIKDLDSSNGTKLNDKNISQAVLQNNDRIQAGHTIFRVKFDSITPSIKKELNSTEKTVTDEGSVFSIDQNLDSTLPANIVNKTSFNIGLVLWEDKHGRYGLTIIAKGSFTIEADSVSTFLDKKIPVFNYDIFYDEDIFGSIKYESDLAPFKPATDIVVVGKAYSPNKKLVQALDVGIKVGETESVIRVFGDRKWEQIGNSNSYKISDPKPFSSMSLVYEKSFGGGDFEHGIYCESNHIGCGCINKDSLKNAELQKLPNLENPNNLITSLKSRPNPVGFGFLRKNWAPRLQYVGTYDEEYMENGSLRQPKDFSYKFYNSSHPDLQVSEYINGDEQVELVNLSAVSRLKFKLPNITPYFSVTNDVGNTLERVKMNLDTLVFIPDEDVFYQVFRGVYELDSFEAFQKVLVEVDSESTND